MMKPGNICRVCSSPAQYSIFMVIPAYLHPHPHDFLEWRKEISTLLQEVTGLQVNSNDGLPTKICAICITYLKHAASFRQQAIDNILSLKAAQKIIGNKDVKIPFDENNVGNNVINEDKINIAIPKNDLIRNNITKTDKNNIENTVLNNQAKCSQYVKKRLLFDDKMLNNDDNRSSEDEMNNLKEFLNISFDKNTPTRGAAKPFRKKCNDSPHGSKSQTTSSDDNEAYDNIFSYKERNFEEDDIMTSDFLKEFNITVTIPEKFKERKCQACYRRFMFEDSFKEHTNICVEFKFLRLAEEINGLCMIRKSKNISPHEFIRRMIFTLKKTCQWLAANGSCSEILLPDVMLQNDVKKRTISEEKSSGGENSSYCKSDDNKLISFNETDNFSKIKNNSKMNETVFEMSTVKPTSTPKGTDNVEEKEEKEEEEENSLIKLLRKTADPTFIQPNISKTPDLLLNRLKSNEIYNQSWNVKNNFIPYEKNLGGGYSGTVKKDNNISGMGPHTFHPIAANITSSGNFTTPLKPVPNQISNPQLHNLKLRYSARCNQCNVQFQSIDFLEEHNANHHNDNKKMEEHKRIISLFESED